MSETATVEREFQAWPKIARLKRDTIITEKIDGTNACVVVAADGDVYAQSRTRVITPEDDNFGFAKWVDANADELRSTLGEGRHFGEWWGAGIQRRYGLDHKRFSLFNSGRWTADESDGHRCVEAPLCYVVPVLASGPFSATLADEQIEWLREHGSMAAPGFDNPEGIVAFHAASRMLFKVTLDKDEQHKGAA